MESSLRLSFLFIFKIAKSPSAPSQLKESMDLYEELVTEEQHSRESSYTEVNRHYLLCYLYCRTLPVQKAK